MGYTHYWIRENEIEQPIFDTIVEDFKKTLPRLPKLGDGFGENEPVFTMEIVIFNGYGGKESYETFGFNRNISGSDFCKTAQRPYDLAVTTFLIIAKHHLGDAITVSSDGDNDKWNEAKTLCQEILGYGQQFALPKG